MSKNPLINGLSASAYIFLVVLVMDWGTKRVPQEDSLMAPIVIISLFTLSAAVMGYLFCYTPLQLYFDGKKKSAVQLFLQTVVVFASLTCLYIALFFSGILL